MDYLQKFNRQARLSLFSGLLASSLILIVIGYAADQVLHVNHLVIIGGLVIVALVLAGLAAMLLEHYLIQPLQALWQTVLHLSPDVSENIKAPELDQLKFGHDLAATLSSHIYQLINLADKTTVDNNTKAKDLAHNFIAQNLPLPLIVLDSHETINFANPAAASYLGFQVSDLIGKNIYMVLDMAFPSEDTFDAWLKTSKAATATTSKTWERVRLDIRDNHPTLLFDLAAYYNKANPDHHETMLILFDHTKEYSQDDQAISFIALSVHELRTPLTLLRGYIEVFEEELSGKLDPDLQGFMEKMEVQAEQLMAFVNNILNVARVDDNQLELKLKSGNWAEILKSAIDSLNLQAKVKGINLKLTVADNLPEVGVDAISIQEVINNLIDNAIKYSGGSHTVDISAHKTSDGLVETTVQDYGLGIPTAVLPNLFTKFYRDHRNRSQIGGTGLGLYLSKAIVTAHGGDIWVRSKEGEGSTFGFTLQPYDQISNEAKDISDGEIIRGAHGWIKNHSLYRR